MLDDLFGQRYRVSFDRVSPGCLDINVWTFIDILKSLIMMSILSSKICPDSRPIKAYFDALEVHWPCTTISFKALPWYMREELVLELTKDKIKTIECLSWQKQRCVIKSLVCKYRWGGIKAVLRRNDLAPRLFQILQKRRLSDPMFLAPNWGDL